MCDKNENREGERETDRHTNPTILLLGQPDSSASPSREQNANIDALAKPHATIVVVSTVQFITTSVDG